MTIPENLQVYALDGVTPIHRDETGELMVAKFQVFVESRTTDPAFLDGNRWTMEMIISAKRVRDAFYGRSPGDTVNLLEADWERLKRSTEHGSYNPNVASSLIPFMTAVVEAQDNAPSTTAGTQKSVRIKRRT